jgi:hypothetical protein
MAVLVGGHFFAMPPERLVGPLLWTVDSGITIMLLEMYGSMHWLLEVRGLLTVVKLVLVLLVPVFWSQRIWILLSIIVIGFVGSHMPGRLRYYCPFDGTVGHTRNG